MSSSKTTELKEIIIGLRAADQVEKNAKKRKDSLRAQLFEIATEESSHGVLSRQVIKIPLGFLNNVGMQENNFLASRYPGWIKVKSRKVDDAGEEDSNGTWIEFLLEQDPLYLPYKTEVQDDGLTITAGRQIQQKSPEIDQRTLQKDLPDVFDEIMVPKVHLEVDTAKLKKLLAKQPELLSRVQLHFAYPDPVAKLLPIKEKKSE